MKKLTTYAVVSAAVLTMLAACGGGGGVTPTSSAAPVAPVATISDATDQFVGTWVGCEDTSVSFATPTSFKSVGVITKASATVLNANDVETRYASKDCSGAPYVVSPQAMAGGATNPTTYVQTATFVGTKTVGTITAYKFDVVEQGAIGIFKQILSISGNQLFSGITSTGATLDTSGYPDKLDTIFFSTKQ